jgi:hypothetical protein
MAWGPLIFDQLAVRYDHHRRQSKEERCAPNLDALRSDELRQLSQVWLIVATLVPKYHSAIDDVSVRELQPIVPRPNCRGRRARRIVSREHQDVTQRRLGRVLSRTAIEAAGQIESISRER